MTFVQLKVSALIVGLIMRKSYAVCSDVKFNGKVNGVCFVWMGAAIKL